ncbi:Similar to Enolase-phosphatase E1; acc. no. D1ZPB8 [Pyronema omphalodes CBS 100304]|uniref:Similar to Enolase-phosphatase E1 acc. no. D1ZPB8 n=1 Tax=Pyronema omphalodes (strain CBS 100304) TaxID=1076935 RepID=U4LQK9_PYROM|nr:Similar to Enolase-phosphatase E1; acc. no. D1ZPB8 [Pyronema omphalodes CBS 100304]
MKDMTPLFSGYYDTVNAGMKQEAASYVKIAKAEEEAGLGDEGKWLFCSDMVREVEAAKAAGMNAVVVIRPGNSPLTEEDRAAHQVVYTFADLLN